MRHLISLSLLAILLFSCNDESVSDQTTNPIVQQTKETQKDLTNETIEKIEKIDSTVSEIKEVEIEKKKEEVVEKKVEVEKPKKKKKRSKISFEKTNWAFGDIKVGDIVNHEFKFKNIGNAPLLIKNVTATCGCTQPSFPFMPIQPGEEGLIGVTFNSAGKINEQRPTVTVITNGRPSSVKLHLEGMVRPK